MEDKIKSILFYMMADVKSMRNELETPRWKKFIQWDIHQSLMEYVSFFEEHYNEIAEAVGHHMIIEENAS